MTQETKEEIKSAVISVLSNIYDPEIPVDIYRLGMIYNIDIDDEANVSILMTVTAPTCPVAETLPQYVRQQVSAIMSVKSCNVELTFEPAWSPANLSEEVKAELGLDEFLEGFSPSDFLY